jgi:hypothetical protein
VSVRLSPYWFSIFAVVAEVLILYCWIAFALRKRDHTFASFFRASNPAQVSAGLDGKGSLSTFQTLAFSLAVAALITLLLLQTGTLVDLSGSILTLLGISGIGATIAKGTDSQRNTLSADNRAWLLRHGWIPMAKTVVDPSNATWRDFFITDGVFDVYRYQSFIFGLVVIGGLIAAGVNQLSTFVVPNTILGIVGLSQGLYRRQARDAHQHFRSKRRHRRSSHRRTEAQGRRSREKAGASGKLGGSHFADGAGRTRSR